MVKTVLLGYINYGVSSTCIFGLEQIKIKLVMRYCASVLAKYFFLNYWHSLDHAGK